MQSINTEQLKKIWINNIVGKNTTHPFEDLKTFLYKTYISRNQEILELLNMQIPTSKGMEFLQDIVRNFSNQPSNPLGFFPNGIIKSKSLTCAGNTMLVNSILVSCGYKVIYARPAGHSLNIVELDNNYYWLDATNNILELVDLKIEQSETLSIAYIKASSDKIIYKIVPVFDSQDIIVNVFGNMEALKYRPTEDSTVKTYLNENKEIYDINLNDYKEMLYKEYFDYIRYDEKFLNEQERIKLVTDN